MNKKRIIIDLSRLTGVQRSSDNITMVHFLVVGGSKILSVFFYILRQ